MSGFAIFIIACGAALCLIGAWPLGIIAIVLALAIGGGEQHLESEGAKLFVEDDAGNVHVAPGASDADVEHHLSATFWLMVALLGGGILFVAVLIGGV